MSRLPKDLFDKIFRLLCQYPGRVAFSLLTLAAAAAVTIPMVPFEGGLEIMLPDDSEARRAIIFLRDADFADKVAFSVSPVADAEVSTTLIEVMDQLTKEFEKSPLVDQVVRLPDTSGMMGDLLFFLDHFDELARPEDMELLQERLRKEEIAREIRRGYLQMLKPEGAFMQDILRRDPLGISTIVLQRIHAVSQSFGYRVIFQDGHLLHPDEEHGLLLLETGIPITDTVGSRNLVSYLNKVRDDMPAGFAAEFVSGHQRSVSNENLLRRDIQLTVSLAAIGFLTLFLVVFRDFRAAVIFFIPLLSILLSIHISSWFLGRLSYLVIGFGAVMAGIAVDYGIHIYVSLRKNKDPLPAVRRLLRPIALGGLTTLSVFLAFFASAIPGYRQLAWFAVLSIGLSIGSAVFFLPPLAGGGNKKRMPGGHAEPGDADNDKTRGDRRGFLVNETESASRPDGPVTGYGWKRPLFFLLSLLIAGWLAAQVKLDTELTRLDGTEAEVVEAEEKFRERWSDQEQVHAMVVVPGQTREQAAVGSDYLYRRVTAKIPAEEFISLTPVWPSTAERLENQRRWRQFWTRERIEETRVMIRDAAEPYGFSVDAFEPFFELLERDGKVIADDVRARDNRILQQLKSRFVLTSEKNEQQEEVRIISFFPDRPEVLKTVAAEASAVPGAFTVSMHGVAEDLAGTTAREAILISSIALLLIMLVVFGLMRDLRLSLAALLPAATGVLWLLAFMRLTGLTVNVANMIAGIVVLGLCIDYGIFMVHGWQAGRMLFIITRQAVMLSAATTLMGTGVLLFARHPALFSIGVTLTVGVSAGFLAAIFGVPGLCRWLAVKSGSR